MNFVPESLGVLILDIKGKSLSSLERDLLQRDSIGGLILFSRNYESKSQLRELVTSIRDIKPDILIAVDQEGGRVQRFQKGFVRLPSLGGIGKEGEEVTEGLLVGMQGERGISMPRPGDKLRMIAQLRMISCNSG